LYSSLGVLYSRLEDYKEAEQYFKKALACDSDDLNVWSNLAEVYLKLSLNDKAEAEYKKILYIAPYHIESQIGLGEVYLAMGSDDEDMYDKAIQSFSKALQIADSERRSKSLKEKERAAVLYSLAYARVMSYEKAPATVRDEKWLWAAKEDFENCYRLDKDNHKAERAKEKLAKRLSRVSAQWFADKVAPWVISCLSFVCFAFTQVRFFSYRATPGKPIQDVGSYALLSFGSLLFMVAGFYLPQILKLKVGGIELEKKPVEQITTSASLGIKREALSITGHEFFQGVPHLLFPTTKITL
jgi:tetratricopeptide (TPR) repeat protein